jgi:amino acid transporter
VSPETQPALVRAIGRWSLAALVINSIIGSGIFGLPSIVAGLAGRASPLAYLIAAAGMGVIMACFAEVASQFREAGGPYLYARAAFGQFLGIQMGWVSWLVRLTSAAAGANLFVIYLAEFWPQVKEALPRALVLTLLVGVIAAVNYRGVSGGTKLSNFFAAAKLLALFLFIAAGMLYLLFRHPTATLLPEPASSTGDWFEAVLVLVFAYGGFEAALMPMGEVKDPRRDAPFALCVALGAVTVVYTLIQVVVIGALPNPAASDRPLAAAAHVFLGPLGAALISAAALVSVYGFLGAMMLNTPRLTFALAERGDFPAWFAAVHARFRTPHVSIAVFAVLMWALAVAGTFQWNVILSVVARLFAYGLVCAALPVLRWKRPAAGAFRLRAGRALAVLGVAFSAALLTRMHRGELLAVALTVAVAFVNWLWARRRGELPQGL